MVTLPPILDGNRKPEAKLWQDFERARPAILGALLDVVSVALGTLGGVRLVWFEHYPKEATDGASETFELVVFSSYGVVESAPYLGNARLTVGEPTCETLDRGSVETLVGQEV